MTEDANNSHRAQALGRELAHWRKVRGLTRAQLASLVHISETSMGRYERGDSAPDFTETWNLAEALGISIEDLSRRVAEGYDIAAQRGAAEPYDDHR